MALMKIAFDHSIFTRQRYGGISRYIVHLMEELVQQGQEVAALAPFHGNEYLHKSPVHNRGYFVGADFYKIKGPFIYLNGVIGSCQARWDKPDVLHETYFAPWRQASKNTPVVITVHDMTHERYPELFKANDPSRALKKKALKRAASIICISDYTRDDLLSYYPEVSDRVHVVKHGFVPLPINSAIDIHPLDDKPYMLFVGSRTGYKNFSGLLKAFASSKQLREELNLVAFGGGNWTVQEKQLIQHHGLQNKLVQISGDDALLSQYYRNARLFVLPSLYEGFGFPLLESMSLACPVACSRTSALPEIAADAAAYFDPTSESEMASVMESLAFDEQLRRENIEKGKLRYPQFSWDKCASQTKEVYQQLLKN
jgi:glycosyltransferase involved in cell wall biosynthesis